MDIPCQQFRVFDHIENKHTLYRGKDRMKKFCTSLREHVKNIVDFEKENMIQLTNEEVKSHEDGRVCYIRGKYFQKSLLNIKIIEKVEIIVII